jgi:hypothetical protein
VRGPYKLIFDQPTGRYALYNVVKDPGERADLAESRPELLRELAERLDAWRAAQVGYYADPAQYTVSYPPVLDD